MADIVSKDIRSRMMSAIHGKNTKPEFAVRKVLTRAGFRYRLHRKDLPGTPDVVMPGRRIAIFVHGCFWHQHKGCRFSRMPTTNTAFWHEKLTRNVERDSQAAEALLRGGWRILTVWECATRRGAEEDLGERLVCWIESGERSSEIPKIAGELLWESVK